MTLAIDWDAQVPFAPAVPRPRHLTLVRPRPVADEAPALQRSAVSVPVGSMPVGRLTRRGRLVRTLAVFSLLMIAVLWRLAPVGNQADLTIDHAISVRAGQSLTDVARQELPAVPVEEAVRRLRVVNDLPGTTVFAGQALQVPVDR